jgi:hypothetical protein
VIELGEFSPSRARWPSRPLAQIAIIASILRWI